MEALSNKGAALHDSPSSSCGPLGKTNRPPLPWLFSAASGLLWVEVKVPTKHLIYKVKLLFLQFVILMLEKTRR